ncbi:MAG: bifunctional 4-hydroxy-3-methylbut-2-enyl diphosphate reductase/30S ribosomal protein S1, partial [Clostridium sp.]
MKEIYLADKAGFCFGVKRAVDTALNKKKEYNNTIYTLGPLIHNNDVVKLLENNNIYHIDMDKINDLKEGDVIIIRSHGISKAVLEELKAKKLTIV